MGRDGRLGTGGEAVSGRGAQKQRRAVLVEGRHQGRLALTARAAEAPGLRQDVHGAHPAALGVECPHRAVRAGGEQLSLGVQLHGQHLALVGLDAKRLATAVCCRAHHLPEGGALGHHRAVGGEGEGHPILGECGDAEVRLRLAPGEVAQTQAALGGTPEARVGKPGQRALQQAPLSRRGGLQAGRGEHHRPEDESAALGALHVPQLGRPARVLGQEVGAGLDEGEDADARGRGEVRLSQHRPQLRAGHRWRTRGGGGSEDGEQREEGDGGHGRGGLSWKEKGDVSPRKPSARAPSRYTGGQGGARDPAAS